MPKFPSKVKVIDNKVKIIILRIWKGNFWIWKGHFCIVCQKVEEPWPFWPPGSYVPGNHCNSDVKVHSSIRIRTATDTYMSYVVVILTRELSGNCERLVIGIL